MNVDKQRLLEIFYHSLKPLLVLFRHFRTFVLVGFDHIEEKMEDAVLPTASHLTEKIIMVTGAGGLISAEISRQLIQFQPTRVVLLGQGPQSVFTVEQQLNKLLKRHTEIIPIVADMQDKKQLFELVRGYKPDIIYHTAGHPQLYVTEEKAIESLHGNVFGTKNIAEAARRYQVSTFVLVSSDQAAKPRNLMEAGKRLMEMIVESISLNSRTEYTIIRVPENFASQSSAKKSYHLFEQPTPVMHAVQHVLQSGKEGKTAGNGSLFELNSRYKQGDFLQPERLSQLELARFLKQLQTVPEDQVRDLVISIIKDERVAANGSRKTYE